MDKSPNRKSYRLNGHKNQKIGIPLGIHDKNGVELRTGDKVHWGQYDGIILWNKVCREYWFLISYSKWYGDNEYSDDSYGKGFKLPMDDGARMTMEKMNG